MFERDLCLGFERLRVVPRWSAAYEAVDTVTRAGRPGVRRFPDRVAARTFVERMLRIPGVAAQLRLALRDHAPTPFVAREEDDELAERFASLLHSGALTLLDVERDTFVDPRREVTEVEPPAVDVVKDTTWVAFLFKDDATGAAVGDLKIGLKLPKAAKAPRTVPASGELEIDPCEAGLCELNAELDGHDVGNTLEVVGWGEPSLSEERGMPFPNPTKKPYALARVVHHKVRASDTLKSIAETAGLTWKQLAKFNFGTDDPKQINKALHTQVGCRKKTQDRKSYVFSDNDEPGIVYVPHTIDFRTLQTGRTHTLCVRRILRPTQPFVFSY